METARRRSAHPELGLGDRLSDHRPRRGPHPAAPALGARRGHRRAVGFEQTPYGGNLSILLFEGGFLLAGTLLPFLLVHRIGRYFPRWLLLLPGYTIGAGMTAYFTVGLLQMIGNVVQGEPAYDDVGLPESFFWVAVPAYVVWGVGLTVAARGYQFATRKATDSECDLQITQR